MARRQPIHMTSSVNVYRYLTADSQIMMERLLRKIINKEDISVKSIIAKILISKELMYIFPSSYLNSQLPQDNGGQ